MIAGTLEIQMLANMARLADDMAKAKTMVSGTMSSIEKSVSLAKQALGALGIGLGVGYFLSLINGSINAMDHLHDLSKTTRIAVEDLSGLGLAAKQSGGDLDSAADAINKLGMNIGKSPEKFRDLGITAKDPIAAFKQLADISNSLADVQQRNAVLAAALGKSWQGAAPLLAEGSTKIQEMIDKGRILSGITKDGTDRADEFKDKWAEVTTAMGAWRTKVVSDALPGMSEISKAMKEAAEEGGLLLSVWVGLGGAFENILGLSERQQTVRRMEEINEQLRIARRQLESGTLNPPGGAKSFWNFLIPDVTLKPEALAKLKETIDALEKEKARLNPPKPAAAPRGAGVDEAAEAAKRAAKFLKESKDGIDHEALAEVIAEAKEQQRREQDVRDAMHKTRVDDDNRDLEQIRRTNEERAKAQAEFDYQALIQEEAVQDEVDRIQRESILGRMAFEKQQREDQFTGAKMFADNLASLMNTQSRKAFEIGKIASIASSLIKGYESAVSAYAFGQRIGGPVVGAAFAAASLVATANLINNIRSQTFGGGGGAPTPAGQGASGISAGPATPALPQQQQQPTTPSITLNLTVNGHILDTQDFTDTIMIPALRDAIDNRDVTIIGANSRQAADLIPG